MASERQTENSVKIWQLLISAFASLAVFVAVLFGVIQATGAPPGGVLNGRGAFLASLESHAIHGGLGTWLIFFGWIGCLAFIFALIGAFRHRRSWAILLPWVGVVVGAEIARRALDALGDWLGSTSPGVWDGAHTWSPPFWDAAAYWGASALVATILLLTAPDFLRGLWQWSNGGSFGKAVFWFRLPLFAVALAVGSIPFVIAWSLISRVL